MELFGDGGLKDEGGMIDSESGNEVPIGGTRKGVRDDIPANISEGEFIFPEDVTRYIGLDKLMQLRQEAKMGLKKMEAMGQMGNSDEATMEDDLPFGMADIIVVGDSDEPMEFANGGFVPVKSYAPGGLTTGTTGSTRINQGVDNNIVVDDTVANTGTQSATRSLVGETTTIPRTTVKFKDFMGEALLELRQFINEAGNIITLPFQGGVILPSYTIPEGYTAVVTEETVDTGDEDANAIIEDANNAVKEVEIKEGKDFIKPPAKPAVDWNTLSTSELVKETNKITGVNSTIANGLMLFLGPVGAVGYALMRNEKKNKAAIIAARIAKGGLSTAEVKSLTAAMELLKPTKDLSLLDKTLDFVGGLLGKAGEEISAVKKTSINIESDVAASVTQESVALGTPTNMLDQKGKTPIPSAVALGTPTNKLDKKGETPIPSATVAQTDTLLANTAADSKPKYTIKEIQQAAEMGIDIDDASSAVGKVDNLVNASMTNDKTQNAFPADPRNLGGASGYGQTGIAGTYSTPNVDKNGNSHPNAFAVRAANAQIDAAAAIAKATKALKNVPQFNSTLPGVDPDYKLESVQEYAPKLGSYQNTDADTVAEATNLIKKYDPNAIDRINAGTSMDFAKALMDERANKKQEDSFSFTPLSTEAAASVDPVIEQQAYTSIPKSVPGQMTTDQSYVPPVATQTNQAFSAPAYGGIEQVVPSEKIRNETTPESIKYDAFGDPIAQTSIDSTVSPVETPVVIPAPTSIQPTTTTYTAPAAPVEKGSNSLYQSFLNLVTPFDDKEYQDGKLIETAASKSDSGASSNRRTAKVKSGDTLSKIAKDNNTTVAALKAANNIADVNKIQAGASLVIPGSSSSQSVDTESSASSAIDNWQNATEVVQSLGSDPDPADWNAAIQAQSQASVEATAAIKARTAARNEAEENNNYKGGLLSKPKKKIKATTKKRGLAARK
tara:strand:+ start:404 stop:3265 length:2862 start_codon:yes stop_codon:yes gene_type:complete